MAEATPEEAAWTAGHDLGRRIGRAAVSFEIGDRREIENVLSRATGYDSPRRRAFLLGLSASAQELAGHPEPMPALDQPLPAAATARARYEAAHAKPRPQLPHRARAEALRGQPDEAQRP